MVSQSRDMLRLPIRCNLGKYAESESLILFESSQWFERGRILQELLALRWVEFFDRNWTSIGTKSSLDRSIGRVTGIDGPHIFTFEKAIVAKKMSWASARKTTRLEDQAYCLFGIFGINMPPLYGEGTNALLRLQLEILSKSDDDSLFVWEGPGSGGLLAQSPAFFARSGDISAGRSDEGQTPYTMTPKGLRIEASIPYLGGNDFLLPLNCVHDLKAPVGQRIALVLYQECSLSPSKPGKLWKRVLATPGLPKQELCGKPVNNSNFPAPEKIIIYIPQQKDFNFESLQIPVDVCVDFSSLAELGYYVVDMLAYP